MALYTYPVESTSGAKASSDPESIAAQAVERPTDFRTTGGSSCGWSTGQLKTLPGADLGVPVSLLPGESAPSPTTSVAEHVGSLDQFLFRDAGRVFLARIVSVGVVQTAASRRARTAREILNTLHVELTPISETTTATTQPEVGATGSTPLTSTSDEAAVRAAVLGWIGAEPKDAADPYVEDWASIRDSIRAGEAQHSPEDLGKYSGRVDSVTIVSPTEARFAYSILFDGADSIPNRSGTAIKVDGKWLVTRETVCELLTLGNITCPPRTG